MSGGPADIPDDIMKAARGAAHAFLGMAPCYPEQFQLQDAIARAIMAERERCAKVAESQKSGADESFDERVKRSRKGERNLELAAAAAAGMSHAARRIAEAIRKGEA